MSGAKLELRGRADTSAPRPAPHCMPSAPCPTPTLSAAEARGGREGAQKVHLFTGACFSPPDCQRAHFLWNVSVFFFFLDNTTNDYTTVVKRQERCVGCVRCNKLCACVCLFTKIPYLLTVKIDLQLLMQTDCFLFSSLCVCVCLCVHIPPLLSFVVEASILRARVGWRWSVEAPPPPSEKSAEFDAGGEGGGGGGGATCSPISMLML